jgi:hypothetical protein
MGVNIINMQLLNHEAMNVVSAAAADQSDTYM